MGLEYGSEFYVMIFTIYHRPVREMAARAAQAGYASGPFHGLLRVVDDF
jgi:hypothetical protein